jgi:tetratricopeptide (TPR) repeat protein
MDALLAELVRDPARRRKQLGLASLGVAALATGVIWVQHETSDRKARLCSAGEAEAALVWNSDVKGRIERSMLATGVPYAGDAWQRTRSTLDGYMTSWASMHKQTCEATRIQGEQPESVMAVRMACLDQRREEVRALCEILQDADRDVASRAVQAAMSLPRVDACKDVTSLLSVQPEPADPAIHTELESIREGLAGVRAEYEAGRYAVARDQADRLVRRARAARYHPVTAQALLWLGKAEAKVGVSRAQCVQRGAEAVAEADAGRDDLLRVEAASRTMHWCSSAGQPTQAESWSTVAASALERAEGTGGKEHDLRKADWFKERCFLLTKERRLDDAVRPCEDAWDINSKSADLPTLLDTASGLTDLYAALGRMRDADRIAGTADGEVVRLLGEDHPARVTSLTDRAYIAGLAFDYQAAAGFAMQAVRVGDKVAPGSSAHVLAIINTCDSLARTGQAPAALPYCERAIEGARSAYGAESDMAAEAHYSTGTALLALQRPADAIAEFEQTVAIYEKFGTRKHPTVAAALGGIGLARLSMGSARLGLPPLEDALDIVETIDLHTPSDRVIAAEIRFTLARSLAEVGGPATRIEQLARASAKSYVDLDLGDRARAVDSWLAKRS